MKRRRESLGFGKEEEAGYEGESLGFGRKKRLVVEEKRVCSESDKNVVFVLFEERDDLENNKKKLIKK